MPLQKMELLLSGSTYLGGLSLHMINIFVYFCCRFIAEDISLVSGALLHFVRTVQEVLLSTDPTKTMFPPNCLIDVCWTITSLSLGS